VIDVVGIGAEGWESLAPDQRDRVLGARLVLGGRRHLDLLPDVEGQQRQSWPTDLRSALPAMLRGHEDQTIAVLASGDPLLAGVGGTLVELFGAAAVRIHPAVSSPSLAGARMGWPADTVELVRLRGDDLDLVRRAVFPGRRLLVLSRDAATPAELAEVLRSSGFGPSALTVLGDLGTPEESRVDGLADGWSALSPALNIVCVECRSDTTDGGWSLAPGLPDEAYEHDGQLTKRHLRASALAHLLPRPGELLVDVGAGAGSVGIEWMRSHPSCRAVAVERDAVRAVRIAANAHRLGVPDLQVVTGPAPEALAGLDRPDAVFIGGRMLVDAAPRRPDRGARCHPGDGAGAGRVQPPLRRRASPDRGGAPGAARPLLRLVARAGGRGVECGEGGGGRMTVHFIGAGPGAADLLTVRAVRLLQTSPVCVYAGTYLDEEVLGHCPPGTTMIDSQRLDLDQITRHLVEAHQAGQDVARMCSGDPSLYSALAEQTRRLDRAGVPWDVTPGVPAYAAAAAVVGRELTVPGVAQTVILTRTQVASTPMPPTESLAYLAGARATLVLHLAIRRTRVLCAELMTEYGPDCPVIVVADASRPTEVVLRGTLADMADQVEAAGLRQAAVIMVGEALRTEEFVESHLYGPRVR